MTKVKVLEVSQFASDAYNPNLLKLNFKKIERNMDLTESKQTKVLFPGMNRIKIVDSKDFPSLGDFWYIEKNGKFKRWKINPDTSD